MDLPCDAQADLKERYSVNELLADLAGCRATRVLLFVDQSYSGVLSKRLRGSQKHPNVVLIPSQTWPTFSPPRSSPGREDSGWWHIGAATCLLDQLGKVCAFLSGEGDMKATEPDQGPDLEPSPL